MFNQHKIEVIVPPGPYPKCDCGGTLLPKVEPASGTSCQTYMGQPMKHTAREIWIEDTAVLYWQCSGTCGKRV